MPTFSQKRHLRLTPPNGEDSLADRERILAALGDLSVSFAFPVLQQLYPLLQKAAYDITVTLSRREDGWDLVRLEAGDRCGVHCGVALDIGSTTLAMELVDLNSGQVLSSRGCGNSQTAVGENILDRIFYAKDQPEHLRRLQQLVTEDIRSLLTLCCRDAGLAPEDVASFVVSGNTTMIHFLLGCEPWHVFQAPYAPVFYDPGYLPASALGLPVPCNLFFVPAAANYLGGDILSGLLMTQLEREEAPSVFLDIGTNGELVLGNRDFILAGAGAAGPALEGGISPSGMRAEPGAVCTVSIDRENRLHTETIGNLPPRGICGSGIVDLLAQGYLHRWINGDGSLNPERSPCIQERADPLSGKTMPAICYGEAPEGKLWFTQADIVEFIRTKAAAHTMVATLLDSCGLTLEDVGLFYLSGGFGTHLNLESAITVGLYPDIPREKFRILGNSSLSGARKLLLEEDCLARLQTLLRNMTYVQFGSMEKFLENMVAAQFIPHSDPRLYPSVQPLPW